MQGSIESMLMIPQERNGRRYDCATVTGLAGGGSPCGNCRGFTYLAVLATIIIVGIVLGTASQSWRTIMKREREEELLFRGMQIKDAITSWYEPRQGRHVATPLRDLKDLLQDPRTPETVHYLRKLYRDPMTGEEWTIVGDLSGGIRGVASASQDAPLKTDGFPEGLKDFKGKTRYSEWQFVYTPSIQGQSSSSRVKAGSGER